MNLNQCYIWSVDQQNKFLSRKYLQYFEFCSQCLLFTGCIRPIILKLLTQDRHLYFRKIKSKTFQMLPFGFSRALDLWRHMWCGLLGLCFSMLLSDPVCDAIREKIRAVHLKITMKNESTPIQRPAAFVEQWCVF